MLAFECRLFQPIWTLQSGDIATFPREVKIPIVPVFAEWDTNSFVGSRLLVNVVVVRFVSHSAQRGKPCYKEQNII